METKKLPDNQEVRIKCPGCGSDIIVSEQDKVDSNYYTCGNCFTIVPKKKKQKYPASPFETSTGRKVQ